MNDSQLIALLTLIAQQDTKALRMLYENTQTRMFAVARRVLKQPELAEDALQDAYLQIWRDAEKYHESLSPPLAWMGMIVRSRSLDLLRKRTSEYALSGDSFDEELAQNWSDDQLSPQDLHDASEQALALHQCLQKIESKQREVLTLAYFRDLSQSELAEQLKIPLGTIKTWMRRSMEQLRSCMNRYA